MTSKFHAFAMNLAIGWILYLGVFALAKFRGATYIDPPLAEFLFFLRAGMWDSAAAWLIGSSIACFFLGCLARWTTRPIIRRVNAWLDQPLPKTSALRRLDQDEPE